MTTVCYSLVAPLLLFLERAKQNGFRKEEVPYFPEAKTLAVIASIMYIKYWLILVHPLLSRPKMLCLHTSAPICVLSYTQERFKPCSISILISFTEEEVGQSYVVCHDHEGNPQTWDWRIISNLLLRNYPTCLFLTAFPRDAECLMISTNKNLPWHIFCLYDGCVYHLLPAFSFFSIFFTNITF